MRLPPEVYAPLFEAELRKLASGEEQLEQTTVGFPIKLTQWVRACILIDLVGDEAAALEHLDMDPALFARATEMWGGLSYTHQIGARIRFMRERLDLTEEAARLRAGHVTKGLLEPDPAVFVGPSAEVWALGRFSGCGKKPVLRVVTVERGEEVWRNETPQLSTGKSRKSFVVRPPRIYIGRHRHVTALDLQTGKILWQFDFGGAESIDQNRDGGAAIHEPGLGVVMVRLKSHHVVGLDRDTGALRYKAAFYTPPSSAAWDAPAAMGDDTVTSEDVYGIGIAVHGGAILSRFACVLDARTGQFVAQAIGHGFVQGAAASRGMLVHAFLADEPRRSIVEVLDAATGLALVPPVEPNGVVMNDDPVFAGPWVFFRAVHDPGFLFATALPGHSSPVREIALGDVTIQRLLPAEDALVACVSADRTEDVGLCIVDAATLSVRGKTGMLGPRVREGQNEMLAVEGSLALLATRTEPEGTVMVWAVDVHRGVRWALKVEEWRGHGFAGERVVIWTKEQTLLVRAEDGAAMEL